MMELGAELKRLNIKFILVYGKVKESEFKTWAANSAMSWYGDLDSTLYRIAEK